MSPPNTTAPPVLRSDAERNRRRILAAARELFAERGLDASVEEIAARAGVGMGTLYRRFETKDALIDSIFQERLDEYTQLLERALGHADAWQGLRGFLEQALALQARDRGLKEILASARRGRRGVEARRGRIGPTIELLLQRAQQQGAVRDDVTATDIAMIMWGSGGVVDIAASVSPNLWRRYLGLMLDALCTPAPSPLRERPLSRAKARAAISEARSRRRRHAAGGDGSG